MSEQQFFRENIHTLTTVARFRTDCRMHISSVINDCQITHTVGRLVDGSYFFYSADQCKKIRHSVNNLDGEEMSVNVKLSENKTYCRYGFT